MTNANRCVVVADGAHARFLLTETRAGMLQRPVLRLVENVKMENPEHTLKGRRDARKIRSGRDERSPHSYTDHRDPHDLELMRRFAGKVAQQLSAMLEKRASAVVLVAEPHMLGLLRTAVAPVVKSGVPVQELARDYTWCTSVELERHLADNKLL